MLEAAADNSQTMPKQTVTIGTLPDQQRDQDIRYCLEKCKFEGKTTKNEKQLDMIQCSFCFMWFHIECIGLRKDAKLTMWPCQKCCNIMLDISLIKTNMVQMTAFLNDSLSKANNDIEKNNQECKEAKTEVNDLKNEVKQLREQVAKLQNDLHQKKWQTFRNTKSLLIGDSLIRDIDQEKLVKTTVKHISGAKTKDVAQHLQEDADCEGPLGSVYVCVGTNDCGDHDADLTEVANAYETMVTEINTRVGSSANIIVASIPPRKDDVESQARVETLNKSLKTIAERRGATFIDNDKSFRLADNEINDGYLLPSDQLHLTRQGTNRLAKNLGLQRKQNCIDDVTKKGKGGKQKPAKPAESAVMNDGNRQRGDRKDMDRNRQSGPNRQPGRSRQRWSSSGVSHSTRSQTNKRHFQRQDSVHDDANYDGFRRRSQDVHFKAKARCNYCAEYNHDTSSCWFRKPAICRQCSMEGHKQKFCFEFSQ